MEEVCSQGGRSVECRRQRMVEWVEEPDRRRRLCSSAISRRHGRAAMVVVAVVHCAEEAVEEVEA